MTYLSQAVLRKQDALHVGCVDGYAWHCAVWSAFPGRPNASRDFLFRVDPTGAGFRVLLLSRTKPTALPWLAWKTKEIAETFLSHPTYRFQLKANPTMRRAADRRRLGVYGEPRLREWMLRKAASNGFRIADGTLAIGAPVDEFFVRNGRRGKHVAVDFSGVLEVVDRQLFTHAFDGGIGPAKSFGFGLLILQPLS